MFESVDIKVKDFVVVVLNSYLPLESELVSVDSKVVIDNSRLELLDIIVLSAIVSDDELIELDSITDAISTLDGVGYVVVIDSYVTSLKEDEDALSLDYIKDNFSLLLDADRLEIKSSSSFSLLVDNGGKESVYVDESDVNNIIIESNDDYAANLVSEKRSGK